MHDGCKNKVLSQKIEDAVDSKLNNEPRILYISRQYFDQDKGADFLKNVLACCVDADLTAKYTVLAGSYCLLKYIEKCEGVDFVHHSLRMVYSNNVHSKLSIDRRSAINLELISNSKSGSQKSSLYGSINFTKTRVGSRFLKSNLLRPSTDLLTIQTRLDTVELLLRKNKELNEIIRLLKALPDLDKMLYGLVTAPKQLTIKTVRISIDTLIYLKECLRLCPLFAAVLRDISLSVDPITSTGESQNSQSNVNATTSADHDMQQSPANQLNLLVDTLIDNFSDTFFHELRERIDNIITDSTNYSRSTHEMRYQECFAIKSGVDGVLDLARKSFLQNVEDIYSLAEQYSRQFNITSVKVVYTASRGYHLSLPSPKSSGQGTAATEGEYLPPIFIQAVLSKKTIACTTEEVSSLSTRAAEAIQQALILTHEVLQRLVMSDIRDQSKMEALYTLTDSIALVDMLTSFADLVALSAHVYNRPLVTNAEDIQEHNLDNSSSSSSRQPVDTHASRDGNDTNNAVMSSSSPLVIHAGRHPILAEGGVGQKSGAGGNRSSMNSSFQANDTYLSELNNFVVVTGPNSAGKTVFIKQVAIIVILVQIGCYVPARHASIPIRDRILTRLGTSDDMEHNLSTFMTEMKETSYILSNLSPRSLVLIDELGRGTSNIDGLSLAYAIAEHLIDSSAYTLFVTHYSQITSLADMYPSVSNVHLKVALDYEANVGHNSSTSTLYSNGIMNNHHGIDGIDVPSLLSPPPPPPLLSSHPSRPREFIKFTHQVGTGPSELKDGYGILMSELCGFPPEMVAEARNIQKLVRNLYPIYIDPTDIDPSVNVVNSLLQRLTLLKYSTLTDDDVLCQYVDNLRSKVSDKVTDNIANYLTKFRRQLTADTQHTPSLSSANIVPMQRNTALTIDMGTPLHISTTTAIVADTASTAVGIAGTYYDSSADFNSDAMTGKFPLGSNHKHADISARKCCDNSTAAVVSLDFAEDSV